MHSFRNARSFISSAAIAGLVGMLAWTGVSATAGSPAKAAAAPAAAAPAAPAPVFAYYYMWMHGSYWTTNKLDHPVQPFPGNYNSSDPAVIAWQIQQAKAAGITGFIVSWKDTPTYRKILPMVEAAADQQNFKLVLLYESLNAARAPLPVSQVAADFKYFVSTYASDPAWYRVSGKPVTIWSGTQAFSAADVSTVTRPVRSKIRVLNSANDVTEYHRISRSTDGDAYYWSSVNPATNPGWGSKLIALSAAVHEVKGKTWIAPFAPAFNATLIGGHIVVPRNNGDTLRAEYAVAAASSPDIMGLISWNEWTENTYVEPSVNFGYTYVGILAGLINPAG